MAYTFTNDDDIKKLIEINKEIRERTQFFI